ncbi:uncharacterized protein [Antennarius striatus]|uniref:uncharacterized protein n=1 Tax=Antennarius striatus TaxID=241820 RepID=UPI0035B120B1
MSECFVHLTSLGLLSVSLLLSICLNVVFCIRQRAILLRDTNGSPEPRTYRRKSQPEQQENLQDHHEQQENPIYGNISTDEGGSVDFCYEMMKHTGVCVTSLEPDLNYASLDLKVANKGKKKHRHQQGHTQGRNKLLDQLPVHLAPPVNFFFEVETDMDPQLPSRNASTGVSHSSIYLNSQQIAQETEDTERERGMNGETESKWMGERESEERKAYSNGSVCTWLSDADAIQSDSDHFISSFSHHGVQ